MVPQSIRKRSKLRLANCLRAALRQIQLSIGGPKNKKKRHKGALKVLLIDTTLKLHFINQDKRSTDIDHCFFFISAFSNILIGTHAYSDQA
jgi:hypothetical protein